MGVGEGGIEMASIETEAGMRIICTRKDLFDGVQTAGRAISTRSSLPILSHLLMKAEGESLCIAGTDLEVGMECVVPVAVQQEGSLTVPARLVQDMLAALPETEIALSMEESSRVKIKAGTSDYTLNALPPEEFPALPEVAGDIGFTIRASVLHDAIRRSIFAVSVDESRPFLTGVLLVLAEGGVRFVATDTHRLTVLDAELIRAQGEASVIVPGRAMNEVLRLLSDEEGEVGVSISGTQILFQVGSVKLVSRLIEGQFPNYERVVPKEYDKKLIVPTEEFLASVKRASILVRDNSNRAVLRTDDGKLIITAESGAVGRAYEEVEVVREGDDVHMAFNAKYLLDFLGVLDTDAVEMRLTGPLNSALMMPEGREDYVYVVMPMQLA